MSWVGAAERIGAGLEWAWHRGAARIAEERDRKAGVEATIQREELVEVKREHFEERAPIRIEPPVTEIPKSKRVEKEKQKPLFEDLPDSPLPPLQLLDEPDLVV